jgi:hypothetical protein
MNWEFVLRLAIDTACFYALLWLFKYLGWIVFTPEFGVLFK